MAKRKTIAVAITPTQRKFRGYLILDQKLRKKIKNGKQGHYFHIWKELTKYPLLKETKAT